MALIESVCLHYTGGTSDKVYEIHLTQEEDGFRVTGFNGRRGAKLVAQSKTPHSVPYGTARRIFDNLEAAKLNHQRTPYRVANRKMPLRLKEVPCNADEVVRQPPERSEEEQQGSYAAHFL